MTTAQWIMVLLEETPYSMTNYKAAGLKTKPPIPLPKPPRSVLTMSDKNRPMSAKNSPAISRDIAKLKRHLASTNEQSNVLVSISDFFIL